MAEETLNVFITSHKRKKLNIRRKQMSPTCGNGGGGVEHLFFGKGSQVEVSSDDVGFKGSLYAATIIQIDPPTHTPASSSNKKKRKIEARYLVEYATLVQDEKASTPVPLREYVDGSLMRPLPPPTESTYAYEMDDVVDAFHRDGWWTGVVVGVVNGGSKFLVFFENPPEKVEFERADLRVHHDWVDCKWVRAEKKSHSTLEKAAISVKGLEGQSIKGSGTKNPKRLHGKSSVKSMKNKKQHVKDRQKLNVKETIEPKSEVSSQRKKRGRPRKLEIEGPKGLVNGEEKNGAEIASCEMIVKDCASNDAEQSTVADICLQGIPDLNHGYPSPIPERQYNLMDNILDSRLTKIGNQISETIVRKSDRKPRSYTSKRRNQRSRTNNKSPTQDFQGPCGEKPSEQFEDRPLLMWYESRTQEACIDKASNESKDRPQLMRCEGMNPPYSVDDSEISLDLNVLQSADASDGPDESAMRSPAIASCGKNVSEKDKNSPFEKRSPIWGTLEHMEIFQKMPQHPHFSPLVTSKEDSREGLAIGQMVIFSSVVEKISKLQFSDPRNIIDSSLETLSELETHGFDVRPLRRRLNELLSKKENQGQLLEKSKGVEMRIAEQCLEKRKIGDEIREINKKMEELQEKLALAISMEKMTDCEIDRLKSEMGVIDQDLQNTQHDFEKLAAAPWLRRKTVDYPSFKLVIVGDGRT